MPVNQPREHIIAYDIADPTRLARIHRMLKRLALPLQYSVFYAKLTDRQRDKLADLIARIIHPKEDDVRMYPLPQEYQLLYLGQRPLMEGLKLDWQRGQWHDALDDLLDAEDRKTLGPGPRPNRA